MKTILTRFLSALLALLMVAGTFTAVLAATVVPAYAEGSEEVSEDTSTEGDGDETEENPSETPVSEMTPKEWMEYFEKQKHLTDEDKLTAMSIKTPILDEKGVQLVDKHGNPVYKYDPYLDMSEKDSQGNRIGGYGLYVQEESGEVAIKNYATGQILFTNPYGALSEVKSSSVYRPMMAQLIISYDTIKTGKTATMNSYNESAARRQIAVSYIKNGICVEYTLGQEEDRRLVPYRMEKDRFENIILARIDDDFQYKRMSSHYYQCWDMNVPGLTAGQIAERAKIAPVLLKWDGSTPAKTYTSEGYAEGRPGSYSGRMSIYCISGDQMTTNSEKNEIEAIIRQWVPEYNYDMLAYDHELTEYVGNKEALPVFKMALEYRIEDGGFVVRLPANSITFDEENFRLNSVQILPYMGAGSDDYTGYTFIPDGSGTIIRFEDFIGTAVTFGSGSLYGPDNAYHTLPTDYKGTAEKMRFPVYGIVEDTVRTYTMVNGVAQEVCKHDVVTRTVEADCFTATDYKKYKYCRLCGEEIEVIEVVPYTHNYTDFSGAQVFLPATCQTEGSEERQCVDCNKQIQKLNDALPNGAEKLEKPVYTVAIPKLAHTYVESTVPDKDNHLCLEVSACGNKLLLLDENGNPVKNEKGEFVYDGVCGEKNPDYPEGLEAPHTFDPDKHQEIHENGRCYTVDYCTLCEAVVEVELEHTYGEAKYSEELGLCVKTETCTACSYTLVTKRPHRATDDVTLEVDKTNHICYLVNICRDCGETFKIESMQNHTMSDGVCTGCGYKDSYTVEYTSQNDVCYRILKDGDTVLSRTAIDHVYDDPTDMPPSCTEHGYKYCACVYCGTIVVTEADTEEPANHKYVEKNNKQNCTDDYQKYEECTVCSDRINEETVIGGHDYGDPRCIIAEAEGQLGIYERTCTFPGCGHIRYETKEYVAPPEVEDGDTDGNAPVAGGETDGSEGETTETPETFEVVTHNGFIAIITSGSTLASISAGSGGARHPYSYAHMTVTPRPSDSYNLADAISVGADQAWTVVSERKYSGSYTLKVVMLQNVTGENLDKVTEYKDAEHEASYSGMAAAYRQYLLKKGDLTPLAETKGDIPLYLEAFGAMKINTTVLTIPTTKSIALTTFEDLQVVVNELKNATLVDENGVEKAYSINNVNIRLKGFTNGGLNSTMPYKVKFEKVVGGNAGFSSFVSYAKDNKIGVYPEFDFAYMQKDTMFDGYSNDDHAVKTIDGRFIVKKDYNSTYQIFTRTNLQVVSASVYDYFYTTFNKNYSKFENMGVSAGSLGTDLNSDFDEDEPFNREDTREFTERILEKMAKDYGSVMVDGGNAYTLPYVDHVLNMSLTGSNYLRTSEYVPFVSMVLHGNLNYAGTATNMAADLKIETLRLIENGASPYFIIATQNTRYLKESSTYSKYYSLDYTTWKEDIIGTYATLNELLKDVQNATFDKHEYVVAERLPDSDEYVEDYRVSKEAILAAIKQYTEAKERVERAKKLIENKTVTEPNMYRAEILAIINANTDGEYSADELAKIKYYEEKINEALAIGNKTQYLDNLKKAETNLEKVTVAFNATMATYQPLYDLSGFTDEEKMTADAYTFGENGTYRGTYYKNENGKYNLTVTGTTDAEGNVNTSKYAIDNNNVVRVSYSNGVTFYLNYNYHDVLVNVNGEYVLVEAYGFHKA